MLYNLTHMLELEKLFGGWVTTPDKAEKFITVSDAIVDGKEQPVRVPITSNPKDAIPIGCRPTPYPQAPKPVST